MILVEKAQDNSCCFLLFYYYLGLTFYNFKTIAGNYTVKVRAMNLVSADEVTIPFILLRRIVKQELVVESLVDRNVETDIKVYNFSIKCEFTLFCCCCCCHKGYVKLTALSTK